MALKVFRLIGLALLVSVFSNYCYAGSHEPKLIKECPGGKLYQAGSQRVMLLSGSHYQMGFAHGKLLREDVKKTVRLVLGVCSASDAMKENDFFAGTIDKAWNRIKPFIPKRYIEEMQGLADGSGVAVKDIQRANVFPALFHCSGFTFSGKATKNGQLLHGRILDYMTQIGLQSNDVLIIQSPKDLNTFVNVSYAGFIGSVTGMNDKKVAIGEMGGGGEGKWDGLAMPFLFRKALEEADTLEQAVNVFRKTPRTCEYYYVISDGKNRNSIGLYCTPDKFEIVKPGQEDKRIPKVFPDVLTFSVGDRLVKLIERVEKNYGNIDPAIALDIMLRPVAMKSNLHNVLFAPETLELWVAHAGPDPTAEKFQACYQEYHHYNFLDLLKLMPKPPVESARQSWMKLSDRLDAKPKTIELSGTVPATIFRPMNAESNPQRAKSLKRFQVKPQSFDWKMKQKKRFGNYTIYDVQFPSPFKSAVEVNNTVHGEYYLADGPGRKPTAIVLHILDGRFMVARIVCQQLASVGVNAFMLKLPYYGERRPSKSQQYNRLTASPEMLADGFVQGVMDVRRAARWLSVKKEVDPNRIGIVGVSLGGFVAATSAGVDGMFPKVAIIIAGGDLPKVFEGDSKEVRDLRRGMDKEKWEKNRVASLLQPIDPLTFAERIKPASIIMVNATRDKIVPLDCAKKLAKASKAEHIILPADHYSIVGFMPMIMKKITNYFKNW